MPFNKNSLDLNLTKFSDIAQDIKKDLNNDLSKIPMSLALHLKMCLAYVKACNHTEEYLKQAIRFAVIMYKRLDKKHNGVLTDNIDKDSFTGYLLDCCLNLKQTKDLNIAQYINNYFTEPEIDLSEILPFYKPALNKDNETTYIKCSKGELTDFLIDRFELCITENQLTYWNGIEYSQDSKKLCQTVYRLLRLAGIDNFNVDDYFKNDLNKCNLNTYKIADGHVIPCLNYDVIIDKDDPSKVYIVNKDPTNRKVVNALNVNLDLTQNDTLSGDVWNSWADRQKSEKLERALNDWADNDKEIRDLLEEFTGNLIYRDQSFKQTFYLYGQRSCGKSTFFNLIRSMLGAENCSDLSLKQLGGHTSAVLQGKRLNISDDVSRELDREEQSALKKLVSGDPITIDPKFLPPVTFYSQTKIVVSSNFKPYFGNDDALIKRFTFIPFLHQFNETDFKNKISADKDVINALFVIAVRGLQRVLQRQLKNEPLFTKSKRVDEFTEETLKDNDPLYAYFTEVPQNEMIAHLTEKPKSNKGTFENWFLPYTVSGKYDKFKNKCKQEGCYVGYRTMPDMKRFEHKAIELLPVQVVKGSFYVMNERTQPKIFICKDTK